MKRSGIIMGSPAAIWIAAAFLLGASLWIQAFHFGALPGSSNEYVKFAPSQSFSFEPIDGGRRLLLDVGSESVAYALGARTGDTIVFSALRPQTRYRTLRGFWWPGETAVYPLQGRGHRSIALTAVASKISLDDWIANAGSVWLLLFAGFLFVRGDNSTEARLLGTMLCCLAVGIQLEYQSFVTPWPALDTIADIAGNAISLAALTLLAVYTARFARPLSPLRRFVIGATFASCTACLVLYAVVGVECWLFVPSKALFYLRGPVLAVAYACSAMAAALAIASARGRERQRLMWSVLPLSAIWLTAMVNYGVSYNSAFGRLVLVTANVGYFVAPLGLIYAALNRRLLDIGFVMNRAAVFTGVSIVIVGAFILVEWIATELLGANTRENFILGAALALVLGLSMRFIHRRVDLLLDNVFFKRRHDDEKAIRDFAHEVGYLTDLDVVMRRTIRILETHADATGAALLLPNETGYGAADENDEAIVAMRAWHRPVDLHTVTTKLGGDFAFPMGSRGRLSGVLVIGPKAGGESYAPDEFDAIRNLAQSVGSAIEALRDRDKAEDRTAAALDAILESLQHISARLPSRVDNGEVL